MIYTTNAIEGFHKQVRKYTKNKGAFTSDNALFKLVFCAIERINEAVEVISFVNEVENSSSTDKTHLLLLDELDVHLHPDLQYRLMKFLISITEGKPITTIISTHSTAILGALHNTQANVFFMKKEQYEFPFTPINQALQDIIPIFGAHPLSNIFNQSPIILVEGEDDERIWQYAVRSSKGKINLWPCAAGTKDKLIDSVYDNAKAYSLRDRDNELYEINDLQNVIRCKLNYYAAENLILSDEVLT